MNWIVRFGNWLEERRVMRKPDMRMCLDIFEKKIEESKENILQVLESKISTSQNLPTTLSKEFALISTRLNQLELFVGLKREPKPEHVPGMAKIS